MRRLIALLVVLAAAAAVLVVGTGAGEDRGDYRVRAIFDNAFSVIPGEDVRIAGVTVGQIDSLDVTREQKAAVVLSIEKAGFKDFRRDAHCTIRPQSLIGEKFVECTPTAPRAEGKPIPPPLGKVPDGQPGEGQYLLPVERTSSPIDIDLVQNVLRGPYAQRFSILLNELGAGLAGRGEELREVVRRANPALGQTDRVLKVLAGQNRVLADLARDSDVVLAPLARERRHVSSFVTQANRTAQATADRRADLERTIARLPRFLAELRPTMARLGGFAAQAGPVFTDLNRIAPDLSRVLRDLRPFARAGIPALRTLGEAAEVGTPAVRALRPVVGDLRRFTTIARPVSQSLQRTLRSFESTGGIERAMDYLFFQVAAINGFDSLGHYLRAGLIVNVCSTYMATPVPACTANFTKRDDDGARASAAAAQGERSPALVRMDAILRGADPDEVGKGSPDEDGQTARTNGGRGPLRMPEVGLPGQRSKPAKRPSSLVDGGIEDDPRTGLFEYLLGGDE